MAKFPVGGFKSFRKPTRQVSALPSAPKRTVVVPRPKLNDRVQVPNGFGTVEEIDGDMYLIDLENQPAKIWERLTSIKFPR